jgi:hypothetical protein
METDLVTWRSPGGVRATVRTLSGIHECGVSDDGDTWCSCGRAPSCCHLTALEAAAADRLANGVVG